MKSRRTNPARAIARAAVAEARAMDAQIRLALARQRNESLQREINQSLTANICAVVDSIVHSHDTAGQFELAAQLVADPELISLARLSVKPRRIRR